MMDSFKFQRIGQCCPHIRDINLCDTPFCEQDVQVGEKAFRRSATHEASGFLS